MAFKIVAAFAFLTIVAAGPVDYQGYHQQPAVLKAYTPAVVKAVAPVYKQVEHEAPAEYEFSYAVHDDHTGDIKSQQESRKGDIVHGRYELIEPDGHRRIVEYTADDHSGFNAVVHREDSGIRVPQSAPKLHKIIAPTPKLSYAAPVTHISKVVAPAGHYPSGQEINHVSFSGPSANYNY